MAGMADPSTLEVLADTLARAERAEAELRRLRAAANQQNVEAPSGSVELVAGVEQTNNEMDLL